jgi:hypothetical protein
MIHLQRDHHQSLQSLHSVQDGVDFLLVDFPLHCLNHPSTSARNSHLLQQQFQLLLELVKRAILESKISDGNKPRRIGILALEMIPQTGQEMVQVRGLDGAFAAVLGSIFDVVQILNELASERHYSDDTRGDA